MKSEIKTKIAKLRFAMEEIYQYQIIEPEICSQISTYNNTVEYAIRIGKELGIDNIWDIELPATSKQIEDLINVND